MEPGRGRRIRGGIRRRLPLFAALLLGALLTKAAGTTPPKHRLEVRLEPAENRIWVEDRIRWKGSGTLRFRLHPALQPNSTRVDGSAYPLTAGSQPGQWRGREALGPGPHEVVIAYSGRFPPGTEEPGFRDVLKGFPARVGDRGTYLPAGSAWVPMLTEEPVTYRLRVTSPEGHRVIATGERSRVRNGEGKREVRFTYHHPIPGVTLLGGPYQVAKGPGNGPVPTAAFVHPEVSGVAQDLLATSERFLARYQDRYGPYPHPRFDLVSSPWPTGFGFPGLAYIGRRILPLPFIPRTSLPHEILHNWWGNGVYVATDSGNWAEGLTTFGAEYLLAEERSDAAARKLRRRWLADFASYHRSGKAPSLRGFRARVDGASRTLGYNKASFVWIMLRDRLGRNTFRAGLRRFYATHRYQEADWRDLRAAFEGEAGPDLERFFHQWLDRPGGPRLTLARVGSGPSAVTLVLEQERPAYRLTLPVTLTFADRTTERRSVPMSGSREAVHLKTGGRKVVRVQVDPDFRVFRLLAPNAVPPRLAGILAAREDPTIALDPALASPEAREAASRLGRALWDRPPTVLTGKEEGPAAVRVVPLKALAAQWQALGQERPLPDWPANANARIAVGRNHTKQGPILYVGVSGPEALAALSRPLPHYGSYGWLAFRDGRRLARGRWPVREPSLTWTAPDFPGQSGG